MRTVNLCGLKRNPNRQDFAVRFLVTEEQYASLQRFLGPAGDEGRRWSDLVEVSVETVREGDEIEEVAGLIHAQTNHTLDEAREQAAEMTPGRRAKLLEVVANA